MNQSEPCCVFQWGTGEDPWWISIFKWHILTAERQVGRWEEQWQRIWWRGTSLREPVGPGATLTADKQRQQLPITSEQLIIARTSRSILGVGGWNVHYHSSGLFFFFARERTMWCEHGRIKDVDSYRGKFRSTRGNLSVASDKTVGREGKKGLREKHTWLSPLARAKHSFCSTETMEVSKSYFRKSCSSLSLMRRPFSVHWIQN